MMRERVDGFVHVAGKNNGLYTPTERRQVVRALFFPELGQTLGGRKKQGECQDAAAVVLFMQADM